MSDELKNENGAAVIDEKLVIDPALLEEIIKAGVLYGRKKNKTNPRMKRYIFTRRGNFEIIDIAQTLELIDKASKFLEGVVKKGEAILIIGTTPASKELVAAFGKKFNYPSVTERWLGGTLTNFKTISQRLQYYLKLKADMEAGRLEKYTKKERIAFAKEIERLKKLFTGLESLTKLPAAVIIVGATSHETALREARRLKIPVVALISSDADPDLIDYPIPSNDRARSSINWILQKLEKGLEEGLMQRPVVVKP